MSGTKNNKKIKVKTIDTEGQNYPVHECFFCCWIFCLKLGVIIAAVVLDIVWCLIELNYYFFVKFVFFFFLFQCTDALSKSGGFRVKIMADLQ